MNISSMTGFCRTCGRYADENTSFDWAFEIKSVNGKNLDFKIRTPADFECLSTGLKSIAQKYFERGSFSVVFEISGKEKNGQIKINKDLLNLLIKTAVDIENENTSVRSFSVGELLSINGVIEFENNKFTDLEMEKIQQVLFSEFENCCLGLYKDRCQEGEKIASVLKNLLEKISIVVEKIAFLSEKTPQHLREKLTRQINDFLGENNSVSEERLAQEIVFLVNRADICEEIDRLRAHLKTAWQLLDKGGSIGRRFDFLCQELNRETNTTCSKAAEVEIVNLGMELKILIEQLREQVQNME